MFVKYLRESLTEQPHSVEGLETLNHQIRIDEDPFQDEPIKQLKFY